MRRKFGLPLVADCRNSEDRLHRQVVGLINDETQMLLGDKRLRLMAGSVAVVSRVDACKIIYF